MSLEDKLAEYLKQPGAHMTGPEAEFIADMRKAASQAGLTQTNMRIDQWQSA